MASISEAALSVALRTKATPDTATGITGDQHGDAEQTDRYTQGTGSGQIDRCYKRVRTIGIGATDSYNLLAAGSLEDIIGQAIDADELKGFVLRCTSGEIELVASAGTPIGLFLAAGDGVPLTAGQWVAWGLGAAGLNVATNSLFEITETSGAAAAAYELGLVVAQ